MAEVPYRIMDIYGSASYDGRNKYLVELREPAARTVSSWEYKFSMYTLRKGFHGKSLEARSLEDAVRDGKDSVNKLLECVDEQRTGKPWDRDNLHILDLDRCHPQDFLGDIHHLYKAHVAKGMYAMQLERWFTLFGRENVKVVFLDDIDAGPVGVLEEVLEFIGLDAVDAEGIEGLPSREHWEGVISTIRNETPGEKKKILGKQVTPEIIKSLREFFAPHNDRLQELLGRPVPASWSTSSSP